MLYKEYQRAEDFLAAVQPTLESQGATQQLMLGICQRLIENPHAYGDKVYFSSITENGVLMAISLMTPPHKVQIYLANENSMPGLETICDAFIQHSWPVPGILAKHDVAETFASIWCSKTGAHHRVNMRMGIYELHRVQHPVYPMGGFRAADESDLDLIRDWAVCFHEECFGSRNHSERSIKVAEEKVKNGHLFLWENGTPRSMASRTRPTRVSEAVGFVYTPAEHRQKGYASATVARLSQKLLDEGRHFCTLYTDMSNPTSNHIYHHVGYNQVAEVVDIEFLPAAT